MTQAFDDPQSVAPPRTVRVASDDGSFVLRSPEPLQLYARCIGEWLDTGLSLALHTSRKATRCHP